jgi:hypothetical protein
MTSCGHWDGAPRLPKSLGSAPNNLIRIQGLGRWRFMYAKAVIVAEVERLHGRIWNGRAKGTWSVSPADIDHGDLSWPMLGRSAG